MPVRKLFPMTASRSGSLFGKHSLLYLFACYLYEKSLLCITTYTHITTHVLGLNYAHIQSSAAMITRVWGHKPRNLNNIFCFGFVMWTALIWGDKNFLKSQGNTSTKNSNVGILSLDCSLLTHLLQIWKIVSISLGFFWLWWLSKCMSSPHKAHSMQVYRCGIETLFRNSAAKGEINEGTQTRSIIFVSKYDFNLYLVLTEFHTRNHCSSSIHSYITL